MSKLKFDGLLHTIILTDNQGQQKGSWQAYNNVDSHATLRHIANGTYSVQDRIHPHNHTPDANGPYGLHGIIRFNVPHHPGIGVHSGRANARHQPGPKHATMGCIRTTDEAMLAIKNLIRTDPLLTIDVANNSATSAHQSSVSHNPQHHVIHASHARRR